MSLAQLLFTSLIFTFSFLGHFVFSAADSSICHNNMSIEKEHPRWQNMWTTGIRVGEKFDAGTPLPALIKMVEEGSVPKGRALVPGCGRGYDVVLLAAPDRVAVGLDLSETAIEAAESYYNSLPEANKPARESVVLQAGSFFDLPEDADQQFNFVYDYTFLCALDLSVREDWARKMAAIIVPGGELCTIMFPIGEKEGGPPFKVSMDDYKNLLEPLGFESFRMEMLPSDMCHPGRDGITTFDGIGAPFATAIGRWIKK